MKIKKYILPLSLLLLSPIGFLLQNLAMANPEWVEKYYSAGIYPAIGRPLSLITGLFPFSLAELAVITAVIWIPLLAVIFYKRARKKGEPTGVSIFSSFVKMAVSASCVYFLYLCLCGFNYARLPYSQIAGYDVSPATPKALQTVCFQLAEEANELRAALNGKEESLSQIASRTAANYAAASNDAPWLKGRYGRPKGVLLSGAWAYTQTTGMFFPLTMEANYNKVNSWFMYACTIAHEAAHQRGFMREDEANFIAWYVCMRSENAADRYSGAMLALIHATNALYSANPDLFYEVAATYSAELRADLSAHNELWEKYEGKAAEIQTQINDAYLQSNKQEDGVRSYGRMVNLLIGYYREIGLIGE